MIQPYLSEFWRQKHHWEVDAKKMSQGLPGGVGVRWWAKFPDDDDDAWMEINRGDDCGYMEFFEKPSAAQLNAAFPYQRLTITGKSGDALWHQLYRLRLAADDDAKEDNKLVARDLTR